MATRLLNLEDLFEIKCKKCGSTDVDISGDMCEECGSIVSADCNACGASYNSHDFKRIDE